MNIEAMRYEALSLSSRKGALRVSELDQGLVQRISSDAVLREAQALLS